MTDRYRRGAVERIAPTVGKNLLSEYPLCHGEVVMSNVDDRMERRSGLDRRSTNLPIFNRYLITGRRGIPRRKEDRQKPQRVDRYNSKIMVVILMILTLSILDSLFTLFLVENGAKELNPVLAYYLEYSPVVFLSIKYLLTCAAVILVLFCKDFYIFNTRIKARILFFLLPIPFILVIQWQLFLIFFANP